MAFLNVDLHFDIGNGLAVLIHHLPVKRYRKIVRLIKSPHDLLHLVTRAICLRLWARGRHRFFRLVGWSFWRHRVRRFAGRLQ